MTKANTGGFAFPSPAGGGFAPESGMTLRDYFAAQIATTWVIDSSDAERLSTGEKPVYDKMAEHCYDFADALIRVRSRGETS